MADSPSIPTVCVVLFSVQANGRELDCSPIISLSISNEFNLTSTATLVLGDGDAATGAFPAADSSGFAPGSIIEIAAGYGGANQPLFRGIVVGLTLATQDSKGTILTVACQAEAVRTASSPTTTPFTNPATTNANGRVPTVDLATPTAGLALTYGIDVYSFSLDIDALARPKGTITITGNSIVKPGSPVQLNGFGARFGGRALVSKVVHLITGGNWTTQLSVGLADELPVA